MEGASHVIISDGRDYSRQYDAVAHVTLSEPSQKPRPKCLRRGGMSVKWATDLRMGERCGMKG